MTVIHYILAFLCFVGLGLSQSSVAQTQKTLDDSSDEKSWQLVAEDLLVMRIQSRQIFLSDLKTYNERLETFSCLFPDSVLFSLAEIKQEERSLLQTLDVSKAKKNPALLKKFQRLLIAQVYNNSMELSLAQDFDRELGLKRCGLGRFGSWNNELKSLVQAELYLREREEGAFVLNQKSRKAYYDLIDQKMAHEFFL